MNKESISPLTLIAVFAGVIEASALASLPFLSEESQSIYTWFLVGFPFFLTVLFFLTLNFNNDSLFAPDKHEPGAGCTPPSSPMPLHEAKPPQKHRSPPKAAMKSARRKQSPMVIAISGQESRKMIEKHVLRMIEHPSPTTRRWILYNLDARVCIQLSVKPMPEHAAPVLDGKRSG
jgi:hypothetical protein